MNRTFSRERFLKLIQVIAISSSIIVALIVLISKLYSSPVFDNYASKIEYCKSKDLNNYQYVSCYEKEKQKWLFWRKIEEESPRIAIIVLTVYMVGFGLYRFLFPKIQKNKD
ncbi:MAG: hypothetical protein HYW63_05120 [Candidatus Levybacteria bacterium]|nr:hypothetical protein [Candidatus Levybacteria bacterium]